MHGKSLWRTGLHCVRDRLWFDFSKCPSLFATVVGMVVYCSVVAIFPCPYHMYLYPLGCVFFLLCQAKVQAKATLPCLSCLWE